MIGKYITRYFPSKVCDRKIYNAIFSVKKVFVDYFAKPDVKMGVKMACGVKPDVKMGVKMAGGVKPDVKMGVKMAGGVKPDVARRFPSTHTYTYTGFHPLTRTHTSTYTYTYRHVCLHICRHRQTHIKHIHAHTDTDRHTDTHSYTHMQTNKQTNQQTFFPCVLRRRWEQTKRDSLNRTSETPERAVFITE